MKSITLVTKLRLMAAVSSLMLILMSGYLLWGQYQINRAGRERAVQQSVEVAYSVLEWAHQLETAGTHSREQAQKLAALALRGARYGGDEYFWVQDFDAKIVMHPMRADLVGTDGSQIKDADGKPLFVVIAQRAQQADGGGIVEYKWIKPTNNAPALKISYVKGFKPWGWVVGSGVYADDLFDSFVSSLTQAMVVIAIAMATILLIARNVYRAVARGLDKAIRVAQAISQRDLTQQITVQGDDEIGQLMGAMKTMSQDLTDTLSTVRDATNQLAQASAQIATGNLDLSSRTESTAANLEQTAASMEELTGSVTQNAQAARRASECATTASAVAAQGGQAVAQVVSTMNGISASSHRIADIIGVIDSIAFQTNILALNAAVEAARAGEQGRGFAVVASEVRNLAQRSAEAAKEIKSLIQASVEQVAMGAEQVQTAGATMDQVVASVQEVHHLINEITTATTEQSGGIAQVNTAVSELDRMTQQNASLVEESAAAAENLREQAVALSESVNRFRLS